MQKTKMKSATPDLFLRNEKGFTLIEIIAVLVIISVIAAIGFRRLEDVSRTASAKVLEHAVSELNSRELISWAIIKCSDQGWITDDALFAQLDKNIGDGYRWASAPAATGGTLQMQSAAISLSRTPSTTSSAGKWAPN
jgi:prepilin-type N-terminal cleavage/methylation domain-containing protein